MAINLYETRGFVRRSDVERLSVPSLTTEQMREVDRLMIEEYGIANARCVAMAHSRAWVAEENEAMTSRPHSSRV